MPTDIEHGDNLARLAARHQERLAESLVTLENRIVDLMANAPLQEGNLFDLEWAISARNEIRQLVDAEYLSQIDSILRDYPNVAADAQSMLKTYGKFTEIDPKIITQLQTLEFQGFADIGAEYTDAIAKEVYQNTLTGRSFADSVNTIKQVAGGEMARYAKQQVHDSLMQFDAAINVSIGKEAGAKKWKYVGSLIETSRQFCKDHEGEVMDDEKIEQLWGTSWAGKAAGDPFIVRGGYNCGHRFRPVFDEEADTEEAETEESVEVTEEPTTQEVDVVNQVEFTSIKRKGEKEITVSDFNTAMNAITPVQMALVQRLPKPKKLVGKAEGGLYESYTATLTSGTERGGSIVRHEYGHHVDYMLKKELGGFGALSENDFKFKKAFEKDRIALGLKSSKTKQAAMDDLIDEMYDTKVVEKGRFTYTKRIIKNDELPNLSDIVDALTHGQLQKKYRVWGHGVSYYKRVGSRYKEAFANLFALRHTPQWEIVEKRFPAMAARFDEIMEGKI
jgi:hypothetical protein